MRVDRYCIVVLGVLLVAPYISDCKSVGSKKLEQEPRQHDEFTDKVTTPSGEYFEDEDYGDWSDVDDVTTSVPVMLAALKMRPVPDGAEVDKDAKKTLPVIKEKPEGENSTDTKPKPSKNESKKVVVTSVPEIEPFTKDWKYTKDIPSSSTIATHESTSFRDTTRAQLTSAATSAMEKKEKIRKTTSLPISTSTLTSTTVVDDARTNVVTYEFHPPRKPEEGKPTVPSVPVTHQLPIELKTTPPPSTTPKPKHVVRKVVPIKVVTEKPPNISTPAVKVNKTDPKHYENEILKKPIPEDFVPVPTTSVLPSVYIRLELTMPWEEVCQLLVEFRSTIALVFHESTLGIDVSPKQVYVMSESLFCNLRKRRDLRKNSLEISSVRIQNDVDRVRRSTRTILLEFYMVRRTGQFTATLTKLCAGIMDQAHDRLQQLFTGQYVGFSVEDSVVKTPLTVIGGGLDPGPIIAMVLAPLAAVGLILLLVMQVRRRTIEKQLPRYPGTRSTSHSAESVSLATVLAGAYPLTYYNDGLEMERTEPSRPMIFPGTNTYRLDNETLDAEFKRLPNYMPRLSEVPRGAESKNRYANVVPVPETRVRLETKLGEKNSEYINANYVKSFDGGPVYVATQAPLPSTIPDFWRMVWEQQSKVIIMLNSPSELQQNKFSEYFPCEESGSMCLYGDYQILLKYREQRIDYTLSTLELKNMENNLCREVHHFWFTAWPLHGIPDQARNMVRFLMDVQPFLDPSFNESPCVVHCSPGTGRTGTVIAIDMGMRSIRKDHCADIVRIVYHLRRQRAGAVQTRDQYAFIHMALNEFMSFVRRTPVIRPNTSVGSSLDALDSSAC